MVPGLLEIQRQVAQLIEPLHDALSAARETLDTLHPGVVDDEDQRWLRSHILRGLTYRSLKESELGEWKLSGDHAQNGEIHLAYRDGSMNVRVLREADNTRVPPAGRNRQRRAYYMNSPLTAANRDLFGQIPNRLLVLWEELSPEIDFRLRLVRPLEPGRYGKNLKADIDIDLPRSRPDFLGLKFEITDEELTYGTADEEGREKGDGGAS